MAGNGNGLAGRILLWAIGAIFTLVCVIAIPTMATNIIENDKASRQRDTDMEHSAVAKHDDQQQQIAATQADIREIKAIQGYVQKDVERIRLEQKAGFQELKELVKGLRHG